MIRRIEALRFRCLRYTALEIGSFHVLVGANASGKSTLLDIPVFLGDLLRDGLDKAVRSRAANHTDLFWMTYGDRFELAVEFEIPESKRALLKKHFQRARYEVAVGTNGGGELGILGENLWLCPEEPRTANAPGPQDPFPNPPAEPLTLMLQEGQHAPADRRRVITKESTSGNDYFHAETSEWNNPFRLGPRRAGLANLPEDEERFPVALWVRRQLLEGVQRIQLHGDSMRSACPPGSSRNFLPDGANLPFVVDELRARDPQRFADWLAQVRTALPDIQDVNTLLRPEDLHRYLVVQYQSGLRVPSWVVSDGTLRLLALTLLAYIDAPGAVHVIEEPENGIHPQAVECVLRTLASTQQSQVLCASHSPVVLSLAEPSQLLCFGRDREGATDIVRGDRHPALATWQRDLDLGTLFANGVLG